jgi:hypothetical protein
MNHYNEHFFLFDYVPFDMHYILHNIKLYVNIVVGSGWNQKVSTYTESRVAKRTCEIKKPSNIIEETEDES